MIDAIAARLKVLQTRVESEARAAVRREAEALLGAAERRLPLQGPAPQIGIEEAGGPLALKIVAEGAAARALEFGTLTRPAQPFLFSALSARRNALKAALAQLLAKILRESGDGT